MSKNLYIELKELQKSYPHSTKQKFTTLLKAMLGRIQEEAVGGVALHKLTLTIKNGERVGIIGSNGAGESTLLQMLAGVNAPTSGLMKISGKVTAVLTLGIALNEELTGRENIYLDGEVRRIPRDQMNHEIADVIDFAELGKFIDLPVKTYSTGMKARLAFSMITQINPEILIIDETLSVGDAEFSVKASRRISELCSRGAIVLIVSHSMSSICELCNRCILLDKGKLIMDGPPKLVTQAYLDKVRKEDEVVQLSRFQSLVGTKSFLKDHTLGELIFSSNKNKVKYITSGDALTVSSPWKGNNSKLRGEFLLRWFRLDQTLVLESSFTIQDNFKGLEVEINYEFFNLSPGLYRADLEWKLDGKKCAETGAILEVIFDKVPTGGHPVILENDINISSTKIKVEI